MENQLTFAFCLWLVVFAGLFLIKERKTMIVVVMIIMILLLVYRKYKVAIISVLFWESSWRPSLYRNGIILEN